MDGPSPAAPVHALRGVSCAGCGGPLTTPRARWCSRECKARHHAPWKLPAELELRQGAPMPGGILSVGLEPIQRRVSHGELGALHGLLSALLGDSGVKHETTRPLITLRPQPASAVGWEAYVHTHEAAALLAGWHGERPWRRGSIVLRLSDVREVLCPKMGAGWETLRVDALTPVVCHSTGIAGRVQRDALSASAIQASLRGMLSDLNGPPAMRTFSRPNTSARAFLRRQRVPSTATLGATAIDARGIGRPPTIVSAIGMLGGE